MAFWFDNIGVQHVGGAANWAWPQTGNLGPIKSSEIARHLPRRLFWAISRGTARNINNIASAWHNDKGKPLFPTLFGDGHVSNFLFPKTAPTTVDLATVTGKRAGKKNL